MILWLTAADLAPFGVPNDAKTAAMVEDALAMAERIAPCISDPAFPHTAAARAILRGALLRWHESGSGALSQQTAGPFSQTYDTRQTRRAMFWPTEIEELQKLCKASGSSKAFTVDTSPAGGAHSPYCSTMFGGTCSCGTDIAGRPIYEPTD